MNNLSGVLGPRTKFLSIASNVDEYFGANAGEVEGFRDFVAAARDNFRNINSTAKVGFSSSAQGLLASKPLQRIALDTADAVFVSYAPVGADFNVQNSAQVTKDLGLLNSLAGSKDIVFTELGCPSSPLLGSSEEIQSACLLNMLAELKKMKSVRFVNWHGQYDPFSGIGDLLLSYYGRQTPSWELF